MFIVEWGSGPPGVALFLRPLHVPLGLGWGHSGEPFGLAEVGVVCFAAAFDLAADCLCSSRRGRSFLDGSLVPFSRVVKRGNPPAATSLRHVDRIIEVQEPAWDSYR